MTDEAELRPQARPLPVQFAFGLLVGNSRTPIGVAVKAHLLSCATPAVLSVIDNLAFYFLSRADKRAVGPVSGRLWTPRSGPRPDARHAPSAARASHPRLQPCIATHHWASCSTRVQQRPRPGTPPRGCRRPLTCLSDRERPRRQEFASSGSGWQQLLSDQQRWGPRGKVAVRSVQPGEVASPVTKPLSSGILTIRSTCGHGG